MLRPKEGRKTLDESRVVSSRLGTGEGFDTARRKPIGRPKCTQLRDLSLASRGLFSKGGAHLGLKRPGPCHLHAAHRHPGLSSCSFTGWMQA